MCGRNDRCLIGAVKVVLTIVYEKADCHCAVFLCVFVYISNSMWFLHKIFSWRNAHALKLLLSMCVFYDLPARYCLFFSLSCYSNLYTHFFSCNVFAWFSIFFGAKIHQRTISNWKNAVCFYTSSVRLHLRYFFTNSFISFNSSCHWV